MSDAAEGQCGFCGHCRWCETDKRIERESRDGEAAKKNGLVKRVFVIESTDGYTSTPEWVYSDGVTAHRILDEKASGYLSLKEENAYIDEEGRVFFLKDSGLYIDETDQMRVRRRALGKLSDDERRALGLAWAVRSK